MNRRPGIECYVEAGGPEPGGLAGRDHGALEVLRKLGQYDGQLDFISTMSWGMWFAAVAMPMRRGLPIGLIVAGDTWPCAANSICRGW